VWRTYSNLDPHRVIINKGPGPLERGDSCKNVKMGWESFKNFLLNNYWPRKAEIFMNAF
jgi:hypothetical protein